MSTPQDEKPRHATEDVGAALETRHSGPAEPVERLMSDKEMQISPEDSDPEKAEGDGALALSGTSTSASSGEVAESKKSIKLDEKRKWYDWLDPLKSKKRPPIPDERGQSREYTASFWSKLVFQWMAPLMAVGYQRPLELNDLPLVNPNRSTDTLAANLKASFKKRYDAGSRRPLAMAMYDTFRGEFILGGLCNLTASILQVLSPYVLKYLIAFSTDAYVAKQTGSAAPPIGNGLGLVFGVTIMQVVQSMCINHFLYRGMVLGGEARATMISLIFDKAMKLSGRAKAGGQPSGQPIKKPPPDVKPGSEEEKKWYKKMLKKDTTKSKKKKGKGDTNDSQGWGNGRIVNLMSTDTHRIDLASGMFHMIWTSPIAILLTIALLIVNLTYSALAGIGVLVLATPLLGKAIRSLYRRRGAINKITDQRVTLTQEILQSVRFVKYFGWEMSFLERIAAIRKREIRSIQLLLTIRNAINAVSMTMPVFASMLAFITYSLTSHTLDPAPIFSSLALFNSLRLPLNMLPLILGQVIDAFTSVNRIQEFLLAEEASEDAEWDFENKNAIALRNTEFTWERTIKQESEKDPKSKKQIKADKKASKEAKKAGKESLEGTNTPQEELTPFKIQDIDLTVGRNELIAIIGTVGSGKSSLLAALAGDMRRTSGHVLFGATRSFCPQYAWIQNATVRENIIFGKPFDAEWYEKVIEACALKPDLEMLPNGDQTEIGERGITVSGGQKQRLNIARAIYFDSDIVLMDDPLSAVDAHVGRHIFDHAIAGLLKDKCRVLATHQLHVLHRCDRIIWMNEGRVDTIDTFDNLMAHNDAFRELLSSTAQEDEEEEEEEADDDVVAEKEAPKKKHKQAPGLMQAEERAVKSVSWGVYLAYLRASGSVLVAPLVFGTLILSQCANIITSLWLSWWTADEFGFSQGTYIGIYAVLGFLQALLMFLFAVSLSVYGTQASKVMLRKAMTRVLRAPMSFFDTTPLGRITNRFSKDIDIMDNNLTDSMRMYFLTLAMILSVFALIIAYFHFFAVALGPLFILFLFATRYYRASAREIKRHEAILRSHVFSRFSESINGMPTIRAYQLQDRFSQSLREAINNMSSAYYLTFSNQRWLSMRLDLIGNLLVFTTGILVVTSRFDVNPSTGGLVLSYILSIVQMIQFTVRQLAEVENNMNATERIHYYGTKLEQEPPLHSSPAVRPTWPETGEIIFEDVQMRYRPGLPLVLRGLSMHVRPGERIGVVGRTGAGKSSIMTALFRLVELSGGRITIDGVALARVGVKDLRERLAIIPQDPTLFRGTVRSNLDPFAEHDDLALWDALRQAGLVSAEPTPPSPTPHDDNDGGPAPASPVVAPTAAAGGGRIGLDSLVEEEGLNFSLGQRQLMALARALVRGARIIVCDEATSSVDAATDAAIQHTILTGFRGRTLLCIAHRLRTIIGYDRICVMDTGRIAELDTPRRLYEKGGVFRGMCERSGIRREDFRVAEREGDEGRAVERVMSAEGGSGDTAGDVSEGQQVAAEEAAEGSRSI